MYKWHVHSAIGRGRPAASDFSKLADGIAVSLRQFSVSLSRSAEDGGEPTELKITRSQRSTEAFKEVSSLTPKNPRGIDARSLAAKPPPSQGFTISRVDPGYGGPGERFRGGAGRGRGRGDFRGGRGGFGAGARGRGGRGGRGMARGRGTGRGQGRTGKRDPKMKQPDGGQLIPDPYSPEELNYMFHSASGWPHPYEPTTTAESLDRMRPPVISSPHGITEAVVYKMQIATDSGPGYQHAGEHLANISFGKGIALFEDDEQMAIARAFKNQKKIEVVGPEARRHKHGDIITLPVADREKLSKAWVAGHYQPPMMPAEDGNILGRVEAFLRRNETYLPEERRKLEAKLGSLLPSTTPKAPAQAVKRT